ncbi:MAG TPA: F0F1 ATP synthase subunit delta, partial [Catalimonadaceae bacterium]|nr:F0F1 ATP synthase subunit delta [Catalimonadaceae bacterium]
ITSLFFDLILSKGREFELMGIANAFIHEDKIQKGITEGRLVSAGPLTEELRKELVAKAEKMAGGKVFLEEKINPELIGGFLLQVGDLQLDASVSSRLTKFRDQVIDHSYVPKIHIPK